MSESFLQILLYLFGHYMPKELLHPENPDDLINTLEDAGFATADARQAIKWLMNAQDGATQLSMSHSDSLRVFTLEESIKLSTEVRGFLLFLHQLGLLNASSRELIIDRLMSLETNHVELSQIKTLISLLLLNEKLPDENLQQLRQMVLLPQGQLH